MRWPWHGKCAAGHKISGFSGGSNGTCDSMWAGNCSQHPGAFIPKCQECQDKMTSCNAVIVEEYCCYRGMWGDNTGCPLDPDYVAPETHKCPDCGIEHVVKPGYWTNLEEHQEEFDLIT